MKSTISLFGVFIVLLNLVSSLDAFKLSNETNTEVNAVKFEKNPIDYIKLYNHKVTGCTEVRVRNNHGSRAITVKFRVSNPNSSNGPQVKKVTVETKEYETIGCAQNIIRQRISYKIIRATWAD